MKHFLFELRHTVALMRRSPGFFAAVIAIVAAGIAATTAMFSIVQSLLLRPLPYPEAERLVVVWRDSARGNNSPHSYPDFLDLKAQAGTFSHLTALSYEGFTLSVPDTAPEPVSGASVSADFFPMLGVSPQHGRFLGPDDDRVDAPPVAVIGDELFRRRFGADPSIVGRAIQLDGRSFTVVGVAQPGFTFSGLYNNHCAVWVSLGGQPGYAEQREQRKQRGSHFLAVFGRLAPGSTLASSQSELGGIAERLAQQYPDSNTRKTFRVAGLHAELVSSSRSAIWLLFGAVTLVFLVVCANVANLMLARAQSRRAEAALRAALGATPGRLVTQWLTESFVVFAIASGIGAALASRLTDVLVAGIVDNSAATIPVHVDAVALVASILVCTLCGTVFGLVPALSVARVEPQLVLAECSARAGVGQKQKLVRSALVVAQVAVACALLVGSGLAVRSYTRLAATPPGFDPENLATARIMLSPSRYDSEEKMATFYGRVLEELRKEPGVVAVTANSTLPLAGSNSNGSFQIEGRPAFPLGEEPNLEDNTIPPGYFAAMGTPILRGRDFTDADTAESRPVMIISQSVVDKFFPDSDPIGQRISRSETHADGSPAFREIVGIVGNVRRRGLVEPEAIEGFAPLAQKPSPWMAIAVRTTDLQRTLAALPAVVQRVDPLQGVASRRPMTDRIADSVGNQRYLATLFSVFAIAALVLSVMGIFSLVAYTTSQRTRELGIRMALGAPGSSVFGMIVRSGLRLTAIGVGVGVLLALVAGRVLAARFTEISAFDAVVFGVVPSALLLAGAASSLWPALRAVRIPPATALRYE